MSAAADIRRSYRKVIAAAEARASADVREGIDNLRAEVEQKTWPWEREPLVHSIRRLEEHLGEAVAPAATVDSDG